MWRSASLGQYFLMTLVSWSRAVAAHFRQDTHAPVWNQSSSPPSGRLHSSLVPGLRASPLLLPLAIRWFVHLASSRIWPFAFWIFSSEGSWRCFSTTSWVAPLHRSYLGGIYMGWPSTYSICFHSLTLVKFTHIVPSVASALTSLWGQFRPWGCREIAGPKAQNQASILVWPFWASISFFSLTVVSGHWFH